MKKNYAFIFVFAMSLLSYVKIAAQCSTPSPAPYHEGFSSITANNQLPACWAASNPSVTCLTFTGSGQPGSRAAFYNSPAGVNYFYTGGIQLHPGITYSAGLFHITDNTGSSNWTDLSILLGSSQSPTGLVSLASTGGPANSTAYTPLSNTFAVTSSGVYYLAIRGTCNASGSSQYLYFDELNLSIPCSQNSPSLSVIANPSVLCSGQAETLTATGADTYTWTLMNSSATGNSSVFINTPAQSANYSVTGTSTLSGCSSSFTKTVLIPPPALVSCFVDSPDNSACPGEVLTLHAGGNAATYSWSPMGVVGANATVVPTSNSTYTVFGSTATSTCASAATISIVLKNSPTVTAQSSATMICAGQSVTFTAQGGDAYAWVSPSGATSTLSTFAVSPTAPAVYTVTGTNQISGCSATFAITQLVDQCQGLKELVNKNKIAVYPNPNNGIFSVVFSASTVNDIEVIDVTGRVILREKATGERMDVSLAGFANGLYYLRLRSSEKTGVIRIVKE